MSEIKVGDRVHWTQTSARGRSLSMTRREGVVVAVSLGGDVADVRTPSGKTVQLYTRYLRTEGERGLIDEFVEGVVQANRHTAD